MSAFEASEFSAEVFSTLLFNEFSDPMDERSAWRCSSEGSQAVSFAGYLFEISPPTILVVILPAPMKQILMVILVAVVSDVIL